MLDPRFLFSITPVETLRLLRRRTPLLRNGPSWTAFELLNSPKHARGIRFADLLLRQEAMVQTPSTRFLRLVDFGNHYPSRHLLDAL
jgi:hypothetical protein